MEYPEGSESNDGDKTLDYPEDVADDHFVNGSFGSWYSSSASSGTCDDRWSGFRESREDFLAHAVRAAEFVLHKQFEECRNDLP